MLMKNYTQSHWSKAEDEILSSSLIDGIELQVLEMKLPRRSPAAIARRALSAGYGTKVVDGVKILHKDVQRRNRSYKAVKTTAFNVNKTESTKLAGKPRVTTNNSAPAISEQTTENVTDSIIAENYEDSAQSTIFNIYPELDKLLNDSRYPLLQSLSIKLKCGSSVSVSKGSS